MRKLRKPSWLAGFFCIGSGWGLGPLLADVPNLCQRFSYFSDFLWSNEKRCEDDSHSESTFVRNPQR